MPEPKKREALGLLATPVVGEADREPWVQLEWGELVQHLSPGDARALAMRILGAAETAQMDATVVRFMTESLGVEEGRAQIVLADWRRFTPRGRS